MKRAILAIALGLAGGGVAVACASLPSPSQEAVLASYTAEQTACVLEAGSRQEADMCRCAVHWKYGTSCAAFTDAGEGGDR